MIFKKLLEMLEACYVPKDLIDAIAQEYSKLEAENRKLQDNLAAMHAVMTEEYERRRPPKQ